VENARPGGKKLAGHQERAAPECRRRADPVPQRIVGSLTATTDKIDAVDTLQSLDRHAAPLA